MFRKLLLVIVLLLAFVALYVGTIYRLQLLSIQGPADQSAVPITIRDFAAAPHDLLVGKRYVMTGRVVSSFRFGQVTSIVLSDGNWDVRIVAADAASKPAPGTVIMVTFVVARSFTIGSFAGPPLDVKGAGTIWQAVL